MTIAQAICGCIALGLLAYLFAALLFPERF